MTAEAARPALGAGIVESRRSLAVHSKSFALAGKLLPAEYRDDAACVYAWCRRADDAIDQPAGETPRSAVARLAEELEALYAGAEPSDPILRAFARVALTRKIPLEYPRALLHGLEMDTRQLTYDTLDELYTYCFRVAGTVGLMMCHVMGVRHALALRHAADLGIAMQLTNICRDVHEDWQRGRRYLPLELFARGVGLERVKPRRSPLTPAVAEAMRPVVRRLLAEAERYYASGDQGLVYLSPRSAFAVRTARLVYSQIGVQLAELGCDVLAGRVVVSRAEKLKLCAQALGDTFLTPGGHGGRFEPADIGAALNHVKGVFPL